MFTKKKTNEIVIMSIKNIKKKRLSEILHKDYLLETNYNESIEPIDIISEIFNTMSRHDNTIKTNYNLKTNKNQTNKKQRNNFEQQMIIEKWNQLFLTINKKK